MLFKNKFNRFSLIPLLVVLLFLSCREEDVLTPSPEVLEINDFIWENMNQMYLWNENIPQNIDRTSEFDSKEYFEKLLFRPTDRWSFITDDYEALVNSLKGIEKTFGHHFKLYQLPNSSNIMGIVKYVIPGSPADLQGIQRGDIFYKVNGTALTTANYRELLFENETYTLSFGQFNEGGQLSPTEDINLTSIVIAENPLLIHKTIDYEGDKIGYLSYNQFISDYNDSLVHVFQQFQNDDIQDLVLDLRYNPGGSINTAILLSSMIAPVSVTDNNEIFSRLIWNDLVNEYLLEQEGEESDNLVSRYITPEVNLNLEKVYILVTSNTASASELVINCLDPYMEVILIGSDNTTGKYVGSITVHDTEGKHNWALQPIVLKTSNANGVSDYSNGFSPHYFIEDDFNAQLGTLAEDMLAKSIELITGKTITDPARMAASQLPPELNPVPNLLMEQKQNMFLELSE